MTDQKVEQLITSFMKSVIYLFVVTLVYVSCLSGYYFQNNKTELFKHERTDNLFIAYYQQ